MTASSFVAIMAETQVGEIIDQKAVKRAEIQAKVASAQLEREKIDGQKTVFFGEHVGISCIVSCVCMFFRILFDNVKLLQAMDVD